ncbi:MAG TPA: hypothetical protein VMK66_10085 [Myxococcales bacterium]|nr:hypothetical protein [Myxococcales bacterium]
MRRLLPLLAFAAACGGAALPDRVAVMGVDRLSGELAGQEVEMPGADLSAVRGPAAMMMLGASVDAARVPDCALRRKVSGALVARTLPCVSLLGHYAAMDRARQFLLAAGAEAMLPAPVLVDDSADPGLRYDARGDVFHLGEGPAGARVPLALNPGAVTREMARRQLRAVAAAHPEEAEGVALFLGGAAAGDPGYLAASEPGGDPIGQLDLSRPLPSGAAPSAVLAAALWAWGDASGDLTGAARAALAASRALGPGPAEPAMVLSLVAAQLEGAERDQACAVFRARLHGAGISACP